MEKYTPKTFRQFLALFLCAAMLLTMGPTNVSATEVTDSTVVAENTEPAQEWALPECDCGSTETELGKHGETCARKVLLEEFSGETAADIFAKWEKLPEECRNYILELLGKNPADAEKLAELKGYVAAAEAGSGDETDPSEDPTKETEDPTKETEASTKETEGTTEETETSTKETQTTKTEAAASVSDDGISAQADDGIFTILAGSDFQAYSDATDTAASTYDRAEHNMNQIMDQIILNHSIEAFMFCGDYNSVSYDDTKGYCTTGYNRLMGILRAKGVTATADKENMFFVQGNHDAWSEGNDIAFIDPTQGVVRPQYGVYVLNYKDYNSGTQNIVTVTNTANNLKNWLAQQTVGTKPIFVISHVPLHYSLRAREKGDAQYAKLIVDVLNEAGQRGLNIIFLYGHNHNEANAGYMGGSTNFVAKGEKIWVSNTDGTTLPPTERTINFTYMNAGFVGWFGNVKENTTDVLTMSVFQISGDDVTITRYSKDCVFPLQEKVGTFYTGESGLGYTVDSTTQKSPYTVRGNSIELTVSDEIRNKALGVGGFATVSVSNPDAGMKYTWHSANDDVATVVDNGDGSATICGWSEGTAMIRVSATSAAARSNETNYSEFYVTVKGKAAVDSGTYFYQRANGLEDGKQYVITTGNTEGFTTGVEIDNNGTFKTMNPYVAIYNSATPYLTMDDPLNNAAQNATWTFSDPDNDGYGTLLNENGMYLTFASEIWTQGAYQAGAAAVSGGDITHYTYQWTYVEGTNKGSGLISKQMTDGDKIQLAHYDGYNKNENKDNDEWIVTRASQFNSGLFLEVHIYERTPLTYTLQVSDKVGEVAKGAASTAETGSMIVKTWATGQIEYIPVTVSMLSKDASTAGTYANVSVTYEGTLVCADYTLVVVDENYTGNVIKLDESEHGYYYRLTDQFVEGVDFNDEKEHNYLILDRNAKGVGVMMEAKAFSGSVVKATGVNVTLDADGVPSVLAQYVTNETHQEWWKHKHEGHWYLYQPNFGEGNDNYLRINVGPNYDALSGYVDSHAMKAPDLEKAPDYTSATCSNYTTICGEVGDFEDQTMYVQYAPDYEYETGKFGAFVGVFASNRKEGREVYIYEKVNYTTATAFPVTTNGKVAAGSETTADTGTAIQITYPDGRVKTVDVTVDMLWLGDTQLTAADIAHPIQITGLSLKYKDATDKDATDKYVTLTDNYTLLVCGNTATDYPVYPDPGSVRVDKETDTTEYVFDETGVARVDLSTTGVPMNSKLDILVIMDTSGSVGLYRLDDGRVRIELMRDALEELIDTLSQPNPDGTMPDVQMAISEFSDYNYFASITIVDGKEVIAPNEAGTASPNSLIGEVPVNQTSGNDNWNRLVQGYTDIQDMQNFDTELLQPHSGTNYDAALHVAYETVAARRNNPATADREQIVIFMTDGMTYQFNYLSHRANPDTYEPWGQWLEGTLDENRLVDSVVPNAAKDFYNPDGKHWMAEAIKGDPNQRYKVIWNDNMNAGSPYNKDTNIQYKPGLDATIYSIGFGVYVEGADSLRVSNQILSKIASDPGKFYEAQDGEELHQAFDDIAHSVRKAATNAYMYDQMSEHFDLKMGAVRNSNNELQTLRPTITVKTYDLYKVSEVGTQVNGVFVTEKMVGTRKSETPSAILETVTFNDAGTEAYSDKVDVNGDGVCDTADNILVNGIINARYFKYNTNKTADEMDGATDVPPETFFWNIGDITEQEIVLSYYVYLENSMGEDRIGVPADIYPTNEFADLHYTNYQNNPCVKHTVSPTLPWQTAVVNYAFYLVDEEGNIIVDDVTGETGGFANKIAVTQPVTVPINQNVDGSIPAVNVTAGSVLPDGYTLYDPDASYTVHSNSGNNTGGWKIGSTTGKTGTTYVTGYGGDPSNETSHMSNTGSYDDTTVWFAVVYSVGGKPDTVVIDYGIPVVIDVLGNDQFPAAVTIQGIFNGKHSATGLVNGVGHVKQTSSGQPTAAVEATGSFGGAVLENQKIKYTLNTSNGMQMEREEVFSYVVPYTYIKMVNGEKKVENRNYYSTVTVIPATTIYYEDDFVDFSVYDFDSDAIVTNFTGKYSNNAWTPVGTAENKTQAQDRPGEYSFPKVDANNIYGYDGAYTDMATYSLGSARKVTVDKDVYAQAQFTFNGTGFDVISLTSDDTGTILVDVFEYKDYQDNGIAATPVASHFVDTYYGYKYVKCEVTYTWIQSEGETFWDKTVGNETTNAESKVDTSKNGTKLGEEKKGVEYCWIADTAASDTLYQVPVMKVSGLPYGKYTAVITATYKSGLDHNKADASYDFYLDAIRIYDPANDGDGNKVIKDAYVADHEGWPEYFELRNLIIKKAEYDSLGDASVSGIVFIDNTADESQGYSISDYTNYGPNNELYLAPGQSIAFDLAVNHKDLDRIHLAMKSVGGTASVEYYTAEKSGNTVKIADQKTMTVATATDLYYDITSLNNKTVVIKNNSGAILSITNVKVTYTAEHTDSLDNSYCTVNTAVAKTALMSLRSMAPEEPEVPETTVPETTVPETTVPETTVPETTVPEETVPETTVPEEPEEPEVFEPKKFSVKLSDSSVKVGSKVTVTVTTGTDVDCITVNGVKVSKYSGSRYSSTRTWQVRVEAEEVGQMDVAVVCYNSENLASQPIVRTVTVTKQYTSITNVVKDLITGFFDRLWGSR